MKIFHLPRIGRARDIVNEIDVRKENKKRKLRNSRCFGTNSCDCPRCSGR